MEHKMSKKNEVAVTETGTSLAHLEDAFASQAGEGLENVQSKDLVIPRITILQALSPQIQPKKPEYIKGAQAGDICDIGTGEIFEAPLEFLPVHYVKQWLEWAPRSSGKGLVKVHDTDEILDHCQMNAKNQSHTSDGNLIQETAQFYGLNLSAGGRRCFLPLSSTQLKKARRWLTLAMSERAVRGDGTAYNPPLFYRVYNLSTVEESNPNGDWAGWKIERGLKLSEHPDAAILFTEAVAFRDTLKSGKAKSDFAIEGHSSDEM
jgi:hypothetical protein